MNIKALTAACAILIAAFGAVVTPAEARPFRHHHGYHHHHRFHHRYHHRFHHRHHGIVGRVVRGVARGL